MLRYKGGGEASRECPECHSKRIWKDGKTPDGDDLSNVEEYGSEYQIARMESNHYEDETLEIIKKKEEKPDSTQLMKKLS